MPLGDLHHAIVRFDTSDPSWWASLTLGQQLAAFLYFIVAAGMVWMSVISKMPWRFQLGMFVGVTFMTLLQQAARGLMML